MKNMYLILVLLVFSLFIPNAGISGDEIHVQVLAKDTVSWNGAKLPQYKKGKPEITILKIVIPPKTKLPWHKHPVINAGVLLKGNLTVITKENKVLHLKEGDPIVEVVNKWHFGENTSNEPAVIIMFYAGTKGVPITVVDHSKEKIAK